MSLLHNSHTSNVYELSSSPDTSNFNDWAQVPSLFQTELLSLFLLFAAPPAMAPSLYGWS